MKSGTVLRKIVGLERHTPDSKHDTRHLECGHTMVVSGMLLHPLRSRCNECEQPTKG